MADFFFGSFAARYDLAMTNESIQPPYPSHPPPLPRDCSLYIYNIYTRRRRVPPRLIITSLSAHHVIVNLHALQLYLQMQILRISGEGNSNVFTVRADTDVEQSHQLLSSYLPRTRM